MKNVPCHKCVECTEIMYTADVVETLEKIAADAAAATNELAITDYRSKAA